MIEQPFGIKAPVAWMPAGLISWYGAGGLPVTLVTAWVALVGGERPRIRTAWHGRHDLLSRFWTGGDFVLNVPYENDLAAIREVMGQGKLCFNAEADLGYACAPGVAAVAPRLLDCAVQIECVSGRLLEAIFETDLCGDVARVHRGKVVVDPVDIPDLCAIYPLSPLGC
jgi:flavin reductase (DIM6/NTAB) family NADH-FMN oxidoreductase RutF